MWDVFKSWFLKWFLLFLFVFCWLVMLCCLIIVVIDIGKCGFFVYLRRGYRVVNINIVFVVDVNWIIYVISVYGLIVVYYDEGCNRVNK